jgi:hypothetical protein
MKNTEIVKYTEYPWGSVVKVKVDGGLDYMINTRVGVIIGAMVFVSAVSLVAGSVIATFLK